MNEIFNHSFCLQWLFFLLPIPWVKTFPWRQSLVFLAFFLYPHSFEVFNLKCFSGINCSLCDGSSHYIFSSHHIPKFHMKEEALSRWKFGRRPGITCKFCDFTCFVTQSKPQPFRRPYSLIGNNY